MVGMKMKKNYIIHEDDRVKEKTLHSVVVISSKSKGFIGFYTSFIKVSILNYYKL